MSAQRWCPVHGRPEAETFAWYCPDDCEHFLAELERRIEDVSVHGNFVRTGVVDGVFYKQEFRNHEPVGEPVRWEVMNRAPADHGVEDVDELGQDLRPDQSGQAEAP